VRKETFFGLAGVERMLTMIGRAAAGISSTGSVVMVSLAVVS